MPAWSACADAGLVAPEATADGADSPWPPRDGVHLRQASRTATDRLAVYPYEALGEEGCAELRALARPFSRAVVEAAGFGA